MYMDRTSEEFAITISKYCRGSLTVDEITQLKQYFVDKFKYKKLLIVNEHKNKLNQDFEHLHILMHLNESMRGDNITSSIKKQFPFLVHKKDVLTKKVINDGWKEYISKCSTKTIVYQHNISPEEIEQAELNYKCKVQSLKEINKIVKVRVYKSDLPYTMLQYIQDNDIFYDWTIASFVYVIQRMLEDNFDFEIKGRMIETKAKLDYLYPSDTGERSNASLVNLMEEEFRFSNFSLDRDHLDYITKKNNLLRK